MSIRNLVAWLAVLGFGFAALAAEGAAPTADSLVARNIEARGGRSKILAVKTMRMTMKVIGAPMEVTIVQESKRPRSFRQDVSMGGETLTTAYDGTHGWKINPFSEDERARGPEDMTSDELRLADAETDIDGPLVDYKTKGHQITLVGKDKVNGADAYKLKVTLKSGGVSYVFLDPKTFLAIKKTSQRKVNDVAIEAETYFKDYRKVNGLTVPYSIEAGAASSPDRQKLQVEKLELDVPIADARFAKPSAPTAAGAGK